MRRVLWLPGALLALAFLVSACASRSPLKAGEDNDFERGLTALSVPLEIQDYRIVNVDGHRGVLLKLSRLPDAIGDRAESNPPRVILDIKGPTGEESPQEDWPGGDALVSRVEVARSFGVLHVSLDLRGNDVPPYTVQRMADWVMIRFGP
jgi:hypothetical protein